MPAFHYNLENYETYVHFLFFPADVLSVCTCVGLPTALWKDGGSDPDAVWRHRSDGSRDEAGSAV